MNERTLRVLEYYKILDKLANYVSFGGGRDLVESLRPATEPATIKLSLDITGEARDLLELRPEATIGPAKEVRGSVKAAALGRTLDVDSLMDVLSTLFASRNLRRSILRSGGSSQFPLLAKFAEQLVDLSSLEAEIEQTIAPDGTILDSASPGLRRIRSEIRIAHNRVLEKLNSIISSSQYAAALQDAIITTRDGRYVVPVKASFKGQLKGIVHDSSASGQTVFVEPLVVVDLNNRWRELQMEEREEIERILRELSGKVGDYADEIVAAVIALAELDLAFAKARYANALRAVKPRLAAADAPDSTMELMQARHPLLTGNIVPIDITLGGQFKVLVITGPNTGGKTVSIKTAGLLTLMAQAGLHIPVEEGSQFIVFKKILADIGDEQSIEQSLSTFSSHMTNIVSMLDHLDPQTLIILDELGAGTDPQEGSALARSFIQFILNKGSYGVITTHYSELKSFAYVTSGVQNASVEFNVETLSPTYRLMIGVPGRSNALAIATRLGVPSQIIDAARELVAPGDIQVDAMLVQIQQERDEALALRVDTARLKANVMREREELNHRLRQIDEERRNAVADAREKARIELQDELETIRRESQQLQRRTMEVEQIVNQAANNVEVAAELEKQRRLLAESEKRVQVLQKEAQRKAQIKASSIAAQVTDPPDVNLNLNDRVQITTLNLEGEIISGPDTEGRYEVVSGAFKMKVPGSSLRKMRAKARNTDSTRLTPRQRADLSDAAEKTSGSTVNVRSRIESYANNVNLEFDIRGWRAEEVASELELYLQDAYLANLPFVRIVHGKGAGVLRNVVRDLLKGHNLVSSFRLGEPGEGGDGVTVVTFKQG